MVNDVIDAPGATHAQQRAERSVARLYAPQPAREAFDALLSLDDVLAGILRTTREPMLGQMRLTWWHDALTKLDAAPPAAHPVLQALARHVVPAVSGARLARMIEGWEELLGEPPLGSEAIRGYATARGAALFEAAGAILGAAPNDPLAAAGQAWALADLAAHTADPLLAGQARALAASVAPPRHVRWSRNARALGALMHFARLHDAGAAHRVMRALMHRVTGF